MSGKFIVLEGIDGAGTTTQINLLHGYIKSLSKYNDVLTTHEPWKSEEIKRRLQEDKDAYSGAEEMAQLYVEDRKNHLEGIINPVLNNGGFVISDRYHMSTFAYQQAQGVNFHRIMGMHSNLGILNPDLTIFLEVDLEIARKRISQRGELLEKFEKDQDFVLKLIEKYKEVYELSKQDCGFLGNIELIDGRNSIERVSAEINNLVLALISKENL